jgi:predicted ATPase
MITRLQVRNFKSLREIDLELGSLNVLVGPNMSGKSNILDALHFLREIFFPEGGRPGVGSAIAARGGVDDIIWRGSDDKQITLSLEAVDPDEPNTQYKYDLQLIGGPGQFVTTQNESLKLLRAGGDYDLITYQQQGLPQYRNLDGQIVGGVGSTNASAMQYAAPNWDGYRFREWVKRWAFYHLMPPDMKRSSPASSG